MRNKWQIGQEPVKRQLSIPFRDERTFPVNEQQWLGCEVVFCGRYRGAPASGGGCGEVSQGIGMPVASHSGNAGFFTRNFTGFDVSTPRCLRWVRKSLNSAQLVHACGA